MSAPLSTRTAARLANLDPRGVGFGFTTAVTARFAALARSGDAGILALLALTGVLSRLFTDPLYANEPSSDEYFYALYAIELARVVLGFSGTSLTDLMAESRLGGVLVGGLLLALPFDAISIGRALQALLNALTAPLVFAIARTIGLPRSAAAAGGVLTLLVPETWETAWRFWPDSQATLLALGSVLVALKLVYRPRFVTAVAIPLLLVATFATKEYAAVATTPSMLMGGLLAALGGVIHGRRGRRLLVMVGLALVALCLSIPVLSLAAGDAIRSVFSATPLSGSVNRTLSSLDRLSGLTPILIQRLPDYLVALDQQFGVREFGTGFIAFWLMGSAALLAVAGAGVLGRSPFAIRGWTRALWAVVILTWVPGMALGCVVALELVKSGGAVGILLALGLAIAVLGSLRPAAGAGMVSPAAADRLPLGLAVLGAYVASFLFLRYAVWAPPDLSAAFTPRTFQPIFPVLAILAGLGVFAAANSIRVLPSMSGEKMGLARLAVLALALAGVALWFSPTSEIVAGSIVLTRRADREGDLTTPGGLRVTTLVEAERWLAANLLPSDRVLTSMPRHMAWYAGSGVRGYENAVSIRDLGETAEARRAEFLSLLARPSSFDYVIDFNLDWVQWQSAEAQEWMRLYEWLRTRPYLEEVYTRRDPGGRVVFYVFRNHRWASSPGYVDREQARTIQLVRAPGPTPR